MTSKLCTPDVGFDLLRLSLAIGSFNGSGKEKIN